ncbi:MAG: hypothetical protein QGG26_06000 [Candidatus Undinarchaeales archaeon]|nr:hypothetical protein [Candidatus Undinarchaeales archaeon]
MLLAVQTAISESATIKIYDWQNNHIDTKNTGGCSCSCPGGTGANAQQVCECTVSYSRTCTTPGPVKAKATFSYGNKECDGKTTGGGSATSSYFDLYTCNDIAEIKYYNGLGGHMKTVNVECTASCPSGTGANSQRYAECSHTYDSCNAPGWVEAKVKVKHGANECDGKTSQGATSSFTKKLYECPEFGEVKIYHKTGGLVTTKSNIECTTTCPCTSANCQRESACTYTYSKAGCKIPGQYQAEASVTHGDLECDGKTGGSIGGKSNIGRHDLFTCEITDKGTYYIYKPGVNSPSTSSSQYVWKKDIDCPANCNSAKEYISDCPAATIDRTALCTKDGGYYSMNTRIDHKGNSCSDGKPLNIGTSWVNEANQKLFSCSLSATGKVWYYVGGTYFVNGQAMDCPKAYATNPGKDDAGLHECTYAGYTPPAGQFVTVSSQKRYCRIEGDYYTKVEFSFSGKNWDGTSLHSPASHRKETLTEKKFNVNWDGEGGVYCSAPTCFSDKTTGNHDFGVAWNIGGEKAASSCCGDDGSEWYRKCETDEKVNPKSCDGDNSACCSHQTDCVAHNKCYAHGWTGDSDTDNDQEICDSGAWKDIGDKVTYYVYHPNGAAAHTSAEKSCTISCDGGTYMSNCESYTIDEAGLCTQNGFYSVRAKVTHSGSSCVTDGNALRFTSSWVDDSKKKVFSCGLDTTMQMWYWVGGHYYVNGAWIDCPANQFSHDPTDNSAVVACSYSGWSPTAGHYVTVSGNKHQCDREGDHKIKVRVHYGGKNWDGTALEDASQDLQITAYNVNWDGHSGTYCSAPTCFNDKTTGAHDFGIAWSIGGETASTTCCGDDGSEWYRKCETDELVKNACKGDNSACCNAQYDCVAFGNCYNNNHIGDIDGDNAEEKCVNGVWQDLPEKAKYRIFHYTAGQIKSYDVTCATSCPSGTGNEAQTYHECTMDFSECKIPGYYQAEVDILHNRPECQNRPTSNVKSRLSKTNLYFCDIDDEVYYYVYHPNGNLAHTSPKKKCDTSCDGGTYMSDCETYTVPEKAICSQTNGYYTVRAKVTHKGNSCVNGAALPHTSSWVEDSKMKVFSCALDTTAKIKIYVGGTTLLNWKDMSCTDTADQFSHDPTHKSLVIPCSYTWDPSPYITHSSMNKRCDYEGDMHFVSRMSYSGKNWDGRALAATYQDIDEVKYNVNWDAHSGIFCSLTCFGDKTTGAHDNGIAWNLGGETASSSCCGDDNNEWYRTCETSDDEKSATPSACRHSDNKACCSSRYDCVSNGKCFDNGYDLDADGDGYNELCENGVWKLRRDNARIRIYSPSNKVVFDKTASCLTSCSGEARVETCETFSFPDTCTEDGWYRAQVDFTYNGKNCKQTAFRTTAETFKNNKIFRCWASKPPVQIRHRIYNGVGTEEANSGILDCPGKGANKFCQEDGSGNRVMKITTNDCPTWSYGSCKIAGRYTVKSEFIFNGKTCDDLPIVTPEWQGPINAYWCSPGYYKIRHKDSKVDLSGGWKVLTCPKSSCQGNNEILSDKCKMEWKDLERAHCEREGTYEAKSKFYFNGECGGASSKTTVEEYDWTTIYKVNFDNHGNVNKAPPGDPGTYASATVDADRYCSATCFDDTTVHANDQGVGWNLGGGTKTKKNDGSWYKIALNDGGSTASADTCCGDDANEFYLKCHSDETETDNACDASADDIACCPTATDCVYNNKCYHHEYLANVDNDNPKEFCRAGEWVDIASVAPFLFLWDQDEQLYNGDASSPKVSLNCGELKCGATYKNKKTTCRYNDNMKQIECDFYSRASGTSDSDWCYAHCSKEFTACTVSSWYYGYVKFQYSIPGKTPVNTYCCDNNAVEIGASKISNCPNSCDDQKTGDRKGCRTGTCQSYYYCGYDTDGTYSFKKPDGIEYRKDIAMTCVNEGGGPTTWRIGTSEYGKETCSYTFTYVLNDGTSDNKISVNTITTTPTNHDPIKRTTDPLEMCTQEGSYQYKMLWQYYGENRAMGGSSYSGKSNRNRYFDDTPTSDDPTGLPNSNEKAYSQMYYVDYDNLNNNNRDVAGQSKADDASIAWRYCDTRCFSDTSTGSQNKDQGLWWDVKYGTSVNNGGSDSKGACCGDDSSEWSLRSEGTGTGSLHRVPADNIGVRSWQDSDAPNFASGKTYNYYLACCPREMDCVSNGTCYDSTETGGKKGGDVSANACHCLSWRARSYDVDKYNKHAWFEPDDHPDIGDGGLHDEAGTNAEAPCCGDDGDNDNFYYYSDSRDYCHYCEKGVNKTSQVDNKLYNGIDSTNYNDFFGVDSQETRDCDGAGDVEIVGHIYNLVSNKQNYQLTCYFWDDKDSETGSDWSKATDCDSQGCHQAPVEPQDASHRQRCTWLELDKANAADNSRFRLNQELKNKKPISIDVATEGWCLDNATHTCYHAFDKDEKKYGDICKDDGDDAYDGFDWSDDVFKGNCPYPGTVNVTTLNCYYHEKALFNETEGQIDYIDGGYYTCSKTGCQVLSSTLGYERELCHPRDGPIPAISVKDIKVRKQTLPGGKKDVKIAFHVVVSSYLQQHGGAPERCNMCQATLSYKNIEKTCTHQGSGVFLCDVSGLVTNEPRPVMTITATLPMCHFCTQEAAPDQCEYEGTPAPETGICMLYTDAHYQTVFSFEKFVKLEVRKMSGKADVVENTMSTFVGETFLLGAHVTNYWTQPMNLVLKLHKEEMWSTFKEEAFTLFPGESKTIPVEINPYKLTSAGLIEIYVVDADSLERLNEKKFYVRVVYASGSAFMATAPGVGAVDVALLLALAGLFLARRTRRRTVTANGREG